MPLFGHKKSAPVESQPAETREPRQTRSSRGGLMRRRSSSVSSSDVESPHKSRGIFGGRRRSTSMEEHRGSHDTRRSSNRLSHGSTRNSGGLFNRHSEDQSISGARERVLSAERAEQEADRAALQARTAVREAREHVKNLEREAAEEARLAKIKQNHARDISKRAKPLGRYF
ncbi:hypothetical protein PV10_06926 [Exophiala mesophila]|uniref:Uncharacterized protein n=1 Tax=Exophiala mesophila TaxID=212818 RepID=A0A0D1ZS06_EXOME|nr:uncharacterized protein PV10_06926 [Exophiala mesophila]KIV89533.1 hypothetical protein PV10_06926 [Exophiala mesophila]